MTKPRGNWRADEVIEPLQIMDAIQRAAVRELPELMQTFIDLCPEEAERPNLTVELKEWTVEDASAAAVQVNATIALMLLDITDDYSQSSTAGLLRLQSKLKGLFDKGFLRVADRALHVEAVIGERDFDRAFVEVRFVFFDSRPQAPEPPLMESVELKMEG